MTTKAGILQAIRHKCLDCSVYQPSEVRECPITMCALWPFRFGRDPQPAPPRGCAKSPLPRQDAEVETGGSGSATHDMQLVRKSILGRSDFAEGEAV